MVKRIDYNPTQLAAFSTSNDELARTLAVIQQSENEITEGKGRPAEEFFDELRARLVNLQDKQA